MFPTQSAPKSLKVEVWQYLEGVPDRICSREHPVEFTLGNLFKIACDVRHRGHTVRFYIPLRPELVEDTLDNSDW